MKQKVLLLSFSLIFVSTLIFAQSSQIIGKVTSSTGENLELVNVGIPELNLGAITDSHGNYRIEEVPQGTWKVKASFIGFQPRQAEIKVQNGETVTFDFELISIDTQMDEVVVTGTMTEISRADSPVPVEIITPKLFRKNPTPSLFESVGMVNGVQPQLNCNVCNTGDIHINGMEGPYTLILIDGMPIVSALSSVYGLSGIPNSMVERIEIVKGPASSLYGSEAMGGIINVITKSPLSAPLVSADVFSTSWGEVSADAAVRFNAGDATSLLGINYFNYENTIDNNGDNFTDMTLQDRISVFNKWNFPRKNNRAFSLAGRYVYEDRWGGEMNWDKHEHRGGDKVYGESIYTKRAEFIGLYQLPVQERIFTQFSYNWHHQDSWYGDTPYMAEQQVAFLQTYWDKKWGENHQFLLGTSFRYTLYDDNTPATATADGEANQPAKTPLPGVFVQDEWTLSPKQKVLLGYRYDYNNHHGNVHSPRIAYKASPSEYHTLRASFGTGFRVVNIFTEDHAALTGARDVVISEELNPEKSYNGNLNYVWSIPTDDFYLEFDVTGFYSYFTNKIVADLDSDPNKIFYDNLRGHAISQGVSLNTNLTFNFPLKIMAGISYMDVFQKESTGNDGDLEKVRQLHAPKWSGNYTITYDLPKQFSIDFTGNWNGPMRLPILPNDYRPEYSPWHLIANVQLSKKWENGIELYGGVKNLLDFVPKDPIMRPFDPFDKNVDDPINNPNGYTFDPAYNYASMQGIRAFAGIRYNLY